MTQESDFKFISVEDDDDEIVIQAGSVPAGVQSGSSAFAAEDGADAPVHAEGGEADSPAAGSRMGEQLPPSADDEDAVERARFEREKARRQARAEANRMITTEEDLKASVPFAGMQRIIIVVAIVLIAGFIAYYQLGGL